jgi:hypothetical protein
MCSIKRVDVAAELRNDERHALGHQVRNERDTARQTVQLSHRDRAFDLLGPTKRRGELWAPFQGVRIFGGLDLDKLTSDLQSLAGGESGERLALRLKA